MLIDTHAHINLHAFRDDADEVMQRSLAVGVSVINVGTEYNTSKQGVDMLATYSEYVYAAVGLHPSHTYNNPYLDENESASRTGTEVFDYEAYKQLALHPKVVGIGECGLDYYRLPTPSVIPEAIPNQVEDRLDRELSGIHLHVHNLDSGSVARMTDVVKQLQKEAFVKQIELARELDKALIIHCRPSKDSTDAYTDVFEILQRVLSFPRRQESSTDFTTAQSSVGLEADLDSRLYGNDREEGRTDREGSENSKLLRFEIHSFTGSLEVAQKFIDLGGYIGLNGIITFDKTGNMETVVKGVPLECIVLETDSPYLAPTPYRGKRNEPVYLEEVAKKIAEWKSVSLEEIARQTTVNAVQLFHISV